MPSFAVSFLAVDVARNDDDEEDSTCGTSNSSKEDVVISSSCDEDDFGLHIGIRLESLEYNGAPIGAICFDIAEIGRSSRFCGAFVESDVGTTKGSGGMVSSRLFIISDGVPSLFGITAFDVEDVLIGIPIRADSSTFDVPAFAKRDDPHMAFVGVPSFDNIIDFNVSPL
jgi:hypothetical protein